MYSFVFQKIALGKDRESTSLSWNKDNDIIAVGFNTKTIKLIKIEEPADLDGEIQLSLNQSVSSSHKSSISTLSWNEKFDKLLSVDDKGLMIVWTEGGQNLYTEEMVNEAGKKRIKFAKWSAGGNYVIIAIEGGSLILGSVEGERLWGKDVQMEIEFVSFLENDQVILIGDNKGGLIAIDSRKGEIFAEYDFYDEKDIKGQNEHANNVVFFEANNSSVHGRLAIGFSQGDVYFVHDLRENFLKKYNFGIQKLFAAKWSRDGKLLAVSGLMEDKPRIFFLNQHASIVSCLNMNKNVLYLDFNSIGDRLLTGFQNSLSFIKVKRPFYYGFMSKEGVLVVGFEMRVLNEILKLSEKHEKTEYLIYYIDMKTKNFNRIEAERLLFLLCDEDKTLMVTTHKDSKTTCMFTIADKKGNFMYSLKLRMIPENVAIRNSRILFSVGCCIGIWDLSEVCKLQIQTKGVMERPKLYWLSLKNTQTVSDCTLAPEEIFEGEVPVDANKSLNVVCIDISENSYVVCTAKGVVKRFNVSNFGESEDLILRKVPLRISMNKNETAFSCFDSYNNLDICLTKTILSSPGNYKVAFSVENATEFYWSEGGNEFCYQKKNKIFEKSLNDLNDSNQNGNLEVDLQLAVNSDKDGLGLDTAFEVGKSVATVVGYHAMSIYVADIDFLCKLLQEEGDLPPLDEIEALNMFKSRKLIIIDSLIDSKENGSPSAEKRTAGLVEDIPVELVAFLGKQKDQQLYNYAAQKYLEFGHFNLAEKLYVQLENYTALKFIERVRQGLENDVVKRAEALMFIRKPKEAVALLVSKNLTSIIPKLLLAYGQLGGITDFLTQLDINQQNQILREVGEMHVVHGEYVKAIRIFERLDDKAVLMELYFKAGLYDKLYGMINEIKTKEGLMKLAEWLIQAGNSDIASRALEKAGENKRAVDVAILNNYWSTAVEIAERNDFRQIDGIIHRSASLLTDKRKKLELAELYRKAKKNAEASKILNSLASDLISFNINPLVVKKVFVLAALEVHLHNKKNIDPNLTSNLTNVTLSEMTKDMTKRAMTTLITSDLNTASDRILMNPWRGAEAWHFYILAIKLLQANNFRQAVKLSNKLVNFELELGETRIYALQAVASYYAGFFKTFSKATSRLETIYNATNQTDKLRKLEQLAVNVFMEKIPEDAELKSLEKISCIAKNCTGTINEFDTYCKVCNSNFSTCVSSGNVILAKDYTKCNICKQKVMNSEVARLGLKHCPLCHTKLKIEPPKATNS
jgi:WD repeat-containing protein 35